MTTIFNIYDDRIQLNNIPEGFTACTLVLQGGQKSDLDWSIPLTLAEAIISKGYKIFWDLQLGLFDDLKYPLSNQAQFHSLKLAVEHFGKIVWEKYSSASVGVCLYRGGSEFHRNFKWGPKENENFIHWQKDRQNSIEQFCQSASLDYIKLIGEHLPNEAEPFALIKLTKEHSLLDEISLLDADQTMPLRLALEGNRIPLSHEVAWNGCSSPSGFIGTTLPDYHPKPSTLAVCIPPIIPQNTELAKSIELILQTLNSQGLTYKLIPEERLSSMWDGLDDLIVISKTITPACKRMLQGFCAAGGNIIYADELKKNFSLDSGVIVVPIMKEIAFNRLRDNIPLE